MKLAIIFSDDLPGKLTNFWTGCYAYHCAWVGEGKMYDMHLIRRRRKWPHYNNSVKIHIVDFPQVTKEYLENKLDSDINTYGVLDYLLFALRPIYHFFGQSTRNQDGKICSEMINDDLWANGVITPFHPGSEPPSPCDIYKWLTKGK